MSHDENLIVGLQTADDAGVYRLNAETALVQTVDFFTPIVDDPYTFGQIAAANALSDIYAMGGRPLTAMNILCFPIDERGPQEAADIIAGGASKVAEAGAMLVGGHSVQDAEPKFGMAVTGLIHPGHVASNAGAQYGDLVVLTKPLGVGIIATAARADVCDSSVLQAGVQCMTALNSPAGRAMNELGIGPDLPIHAATDITGFGVLGHLLNIARASSVTIRLWADSLPVLPGVPALIHAGMVTGGAAANREFTDNVVHYDDNVSVVDRDILADPQTSGGLAIVVAPNQVNRLQQSLLESGAIIAVVIGEVTAKSKYPIEVCK
jgi:selenide,water dikinase